MFRKLSLISIAILLVVSVFPAQVLAAQRYEVLMIGDKDEWVLNLQTELHGQGFLKVSPTGYFGTDTQNAVIAFQTKHGLTVDGKAGPQTRKELLGSGYAPISEDRMADSEDTEINLDTLFPGDKGTDINKLQTRLQKLGYYNYSKTTGYYGPVTKDAVQKFQRTSGLSMDGIAGGETLSLLYSDDAKYYVITEGDKGDDTRKVQQQLKKLEYFNASVTGYFGRITREAVEKFQQTNLLDVDGKVGKDTREKLFSSDAKSNASSEEEVLNTVSQKDSDTKIEDMLDLAEDKLHAGYVRGAAGPNVFDSSGLIYYCLKNSGQTSPRTTESMSRVESWETVSYSELRRGDLVFFMTGETSAVGHVGIYLGNHQFIHASTSQNAVVVSDLSDDYWKETFAWGKRVF